MTPLTQQLEDKKKGCGCSLRIVDLGLGEELFACNKNDLCKTCKAEIAILEQAIAEMEKQKEDITEELERYIQDDSSYWEDSKYWERKKLQSQQTKPLLCDGKDSVKIEGDGGVEHTRNVEVSIENSRDIGNKTADISNLLQKQRQEILEKIESILEGYSNHWSLYNGNDIISLKSVFKDIEKQLNQQKTTQ